MLTLNYRDTKPIYIQIKSGLKKLMITGAIAADEKLPSVRELAGTLAINPNTIQRAYRELEAEGYLYSVSGKGTFAAKDIRLDAMGMEELFLQFEEIAEELLYFSVENLVKTFDGFRALDGADFHVKKGAIYGLVGPNGAGKSTLIRHLTGIYKQDEGSVLIDGEPVFENPAAKEKIAYIPDELFYFAQADTMEMKKFYEGIYPNFDAGLFEKIREAFPSIDTKQTIRRLSKGMQKQVAFWLAISARPQILILDEPVDGLDPVMRRQIWSLILQDVTEHGTTVLVSSHNLRELEDVCDHVGIMNHGKIIIERSLSELQSSICKIQAAFQAEMPKLPKDLEVLHMSTTGRVHTMIVRGEPKQIKEQFTALNPMLMDVLPLSLEEIFIYELGGADYAVRDILF